MAIIVQNKDLPRPNRIIAGKRIHGTNLQNCIENQPVIATV